MIACAHSRKSNVNIEVFGFNWSSKHWKTHLVRPPLPSSRHADKRKVILQLESDARGQHDHSRRHCQAGGYSSTVHVTL